MFHWMLVAPQALNSVLPVADSFSNKEMRTFSRIPAHQSTSDTQVCEGQKQSQLLSITSPLWFWPRIRLVVHFREKFLSFQFCGTLCFKNDFSSEVKDNLFKISTNIPARIFSGILAGQRPTSLPPVIASAISSIVFLADTSWRSSATALLVKLGLFSWLRRSKSVTTCSSISVLSKWFFWLFNILNLLIKATMKWLQMS